MAQTLEDLKASIVALGTAAEEDAAQDLVIISTLKAIMEKLALDPDYTSEVEAISGAITSLTGSNADIQVELDKAAKLP